MVLVDLFLAEVGVIGQELVDAAMRQRRRGAHLASATGIRLGPVALGVERIPRAENGAGLEVEDEGFVDNRGLVLVDLQMAFAFRVQVIAKEVAAVPQAALCSRQEGRARAIRRLFALEFVECPHDRHKALALRRRRVEVFLEADEIDAVLLEKLNHVEQIARRTADAREGQAEHCIDPALRGVVDHTQIGEPAFGVFGGFALVDVALDDDPRFRAEFVLQLDVLREEMILILEGAFLDFGLAIR